MLVSAETRGVLRRLPGSLVHRFFALSTTTRPRIHTTLTTPTTSPITPAQWRLFSTRKFSRPAHQQPPADMFKREVDRHNSATASKKLAKQLFSSSPPASSQLQHKKITPTASSTPLSPSRPLGARSGNVLNKPNASAAGFAGFPSANVGLKRSASGLAKALPVGDGFDAPDTVNSRHNPVVIDSPGRKKAGVIGGGFKPFTSAADTASVYFDENDFDSDLDLDLEVEDPAAKAQVKYPDLPSSQPKQKPAFRSNMSPTLPRLQSAQHVAGTWDSGYESQRQTMPPPGHQTPGELRSTPAEQLLPWSSSPLEHFTRTESAKMPLWDKFAHKGRGSADAARQASKQASARASGRISSHFAPASSLSRTEEEGEEDEEVRPAKRRTIPWLARKTEETQDQPESTKGDFTPVSKKTDMPWNTSASAIKEQQKQLRQAHKKLVKTNDATETEKAAASSTKKKNLIHRVFLSEEQRHVLDLVVENKKSVFFTGSAGTGKSVLLREIIAALRRKFNKEPDRIAVTASTGLAACNIGGVTLHSFAGIGLGKEDVPTLCKKIRRNQKAKHRWMRTKVLVVDEVSMVDGELFDKLEAVARTLRNNGRPFGGIQLVITGDFFQLPPVPEGGRAARFAFDAATWNTSIEHTIALHHVFRQKDPEFAAMLNEMREGRLTPQSIARFRSLNRELRFEDSLEATELFPTRTEVERANAHRMQNLQGEMRIFDARDGGSIVDKGMRDKLLQNCMAPELIHLKKGAQVMLIKNIDETLVNGSLGKVIGFMSETMFDNYQQNEEEYYATQRAGDAADEAGGPSLSEKKMRLAEIAAGSGQAYPVVRFAIADGSTRDLLCQRESWKVELPNGEVQASRSQVPLILAWALSIHKAQGQTLERVRVDLGKVFEKGQAYVALSRATSMRGLQVVGFAPNKIMAHEKVRQFYAGLKRLEISGQKQDTDSKETGKDSSRRGGGVYAGEYEKGIVGERYSKDEFEWDV